MPIAIPNRTKEQIDALVDGININAIYPYSFRINRALTAGNFPTADGAIGNFLQFTWTPNVSIALKAIEVSFTQTGANFQNAFFVSVNTTVTLADSTASPSDEANIIHRSLWNQSSGHLYDNFTHANYYLQALTPVYISFWVNSGAIGGAGTLIGSVLFHTITTGLKV
jgi:hypothetical protein